jgi:GNAT superfamily N-acetyltransferase
VITIRPLPLDELLAAGVAQLLEVHWREIALYQDRVRLDVDYDRYRELDAAGRLLCLAAFDCDRLIGYAAWILTFHLHYRQCLMGANDVIFVLPEYRSRSTAGVRLIRESERYLKQLEVHRIIMHVKPAKDWTAILTRMGYEQEEIIMGKYIGAEDRSDVIEEQAMAPSRSVEHAS